MKVFTCVDFEGFWPVGVAAVVVAEDARHAATLLEAKLVAENLRAQTIDPASMIEVDTTQAGARIVQDGNY